jgi:hypothetical protein
MLCGRGSRKQAADGNNHRFCRHDSQNSSLSKWPVAAVLLHLGRPAALHADIAALPPPLPLLLLLQAWCVWMILGIDNLGEFSAGGCCQLVQYSTAVSMFAQYSTAVSKETGQRESSCRCGSSGCGTPCQLLGEGRAVPCRVEVLRHGKVKQAHTDGALSGQAVTGQVLGGLWARGHGVARCLDPVYLSKRLLLLLLRLLVLLLSAAAGIFPMFRMFQRRDSAGIAFGIMFIINIALWGLAVFGCWVCIGLAVAAYRWVKSVGRRGGQVGQEKQGTGRRGQGK